MFFLEAVKKSLLDGRNSFSISDNHNANITTILRKHNLTILSLIKKCEKGDDFLEKFVTLKTQHVS